MPRPTPVCGGKCIYMCIGPLLYVGGRCIYMADGACGLCVTGGAHD